MSEPTNCPGCGVSLIGDPIPEEHRQYYGTKTHWRRDIGYEFPELYDGVWYYKCPDCPATWGGAREWKNDSNFIGKKK